MALHKQARGGGSAKSVLEMKLKDEIENEVWFCLREKEGGRELANEDFEEFTERGINRGFFFFFVFFFFVVSLGT